MKSDNENFNIPSSPIQEINCDLLSQQQVRLWVKRDDLIAPRPSGNKWRKLKYNIHAALANQHESVLTFGGAFSNHIYATAAAGKRFGLHTIGVIRGERPTPLNPTLAFAEKCGMHLLFVDRATYRLKNEATFQAQLRQRFGNVYFLPEGGTNTLAMQGCTEIVTEVEAQVDDKMDYWLAACGTGGTLAGIIQGLSSQQTAIGISALKGNWMPKEINRLLDLNPKEQVANWQIESQYHHGGYAKFTPELIAFINQFKRDFDIPLDPIYTGKVFFAVWDLLQNDYFPKGSNICVLHTGGLQGVAGFNERFGGLIK